MHLPINVFFLLHPRLPNFFLFIQLFRANTFYEGQHQLRDFSPCPHPSDFPVKFATQEPPINPSSAFRKWEVTEYFSAGTKQLPALCGSAKLKQNCVQTLQGSVTPTRDPNSKTNFSTKYSGESHFTFPVTHSEPPLSYTEGVKAQQT